MSRSIGLGGILVLTMTACGGGGGSSPAPLPSASTPPPAPVGVTASGVITGFSSVFVNGAKYEVENDTIVAVEDEIEVVGDDSQLKVGMKVSIRARELNGERFAERIEYDEDLKGPATDIMPNVENPSLGAFVVIKQLVAVDANTVFDDDVGDNNADGVIDIRDLSLSSGRVVVEVSGLPMLDGFVATRIDRVNDAAGVPGVDDDEFEVKGIVDEVAGDGSSFRINEATFVVVEGAGGTEFEDGLSPDQSLVGRYVEVKTDEDAAGTLIAVNVELEDDFDDRNDDGRIDNDDRTGKFEIEGILASVDTSGDPDVVVIGNVTLQVADASSLVALQGVLIELKGTFDDNGILQLSQANPEVENNVRVEDRVRDVAETTLTTRLGVVVTPTGISRVEDDASEGDRGDHLTPTQFLERVQVDDNLKARGFRGADDVVSWTRIERKGRDDVDCRLRGPVDSIEGETSSDFSFVIQGVTIDVSNIVNDEDFQGAGDQSIGRQDFFDQLAVGDIVQAKSDNEGLGCEDGRLTARNVEFEADDDIVGSLPDDDNGGVGAREVTGTPSEVTDNTFVLGAETITVIGSTFIDDSIIESALGREFDGPDQRFDQLPAGLTLADLLPGTFPVNVTVNADGIALEIEDL